MYAPPLCPITLLMMEQANECTKARMSHQNQAIAEELQKRRAAKTRDEVEVRHSHGDIPISAWEFPVGIEADVFMLLFIFDRIVSLPIYPYIPQKKNRLYNSLVLQCH